MEKENLIKELTPLLHEFNQQPVVFIGSGLSQRYLDLPTWKNLLIELCNICDESYGKLSNRYKGNYELIAQKLADSFSDYVFDNKNNKENRIFDLYSTNKNKFETGELTPIKTQICDICNNAKKNKTYFNEEKNFKAMLKCCTNIITTNYDPLLENSINYKPVVGDRRLISEGCCGIGEIYKIHGSCTEPESIIFTKDDYENLNKRSAYLVSKLLVSFIEQPIIFIGYSINDKYIEDIFEKISTCLDESQMEKLSKRILFLEYSKDICYEQRVAQKFHVSLTCIKTHDYNLIYSLINTSVKQKISIRTAQILKDTIAKYIFKKDVQNAIPVFDADVDSVSLDQLALYVSSKRESNNDSLFTSVDLVNDILFEKGKILPDPLKIIEIIQSERARFPKECYFPFLKYYNKTDKKISLKKINNVVITEVNDVYKLQKNNKKYNRNSLNDVTSLLNEIEESNLEKDKKESAKLDILLSNTKIITDVYIELQLKKIYTKPFPSKGKLDTRVRKLVCILDYMRNK